MNEQIAKAIVGSMLREVRLERGTSQRDIAVDLGLANPNYLSMIEKGTHAVPIKRLIDFGQSYRLSKTETLSIVKLTTPDIWSTVLSCLKLVGVEDAEIARIDKEVDGSIKKAAETAGVTFTEDKKKTPSRKSKPLDGKTIL